jgi:hypothetical protein
MRKCNGLCDVMCVKAPMCNCDTFLVVNHGAIGKPLYSEVCIIMCDTFLVSNTVKRVYVSYNLVRMYLLMV